MCQRRPGILGTQSRSTSTNTGASWCILGTAVRACPLSLAVEDRQSPRPCRVLVRLRAPVHTKCQAQASPPCSYLRWCPSLGLSVLLCNMGTAPLRRAVRTPQLAQDGAGGFSRKGSMTVLDYSYLRRRGDPGGSASTAGPPRAGFRVCRRVTHSGWGAGRKADTWPREGTRNSQVAHHLHAHPMQRHVTPTPTRPGVTPAASEPGSAPSHASDEARQA